MPSTAEWIIKNGVHIQYSAVKKNTICTKMDGSGKHIKQGERKEMHVLSCVQILT